MAQPTRAELNNLADKWLKGTLTAEEKELLDQWYNLDSDEPITWTGKDDSEEQLNVRLMHNIQQGKISVIPFKRRWQMPAAAIVFITLAIGGYFYLAKSKTNSNQLMASTDIKAGVNKAILTLGNGQKIILTDAANGRVAIQNGVHITKTSNGELVYETVGNSSDQDIQPQYNTIEAPAGGQWQVKLPDGSHVWLNALSSIRYPSIFTGNERKVELTGEAYFEISKDKKHPFIVQSKGQQVQVLGTHFNINSYSDEPVIKTTLLEGSVRISHLSSQSGTAAKNETILQPGQQSTLSPTGTIKVNSVDTENAVAWKNGDFILKDEDFKATMRKIARWYNVEISYDPSLSTDIELAGWISRNSHLSIVLKRIELAGKIHFKVEERRITVMK